MSNTRPGNANTLETPKEYEFQFIEVGEPSQGKNEQSQGVIRSHVMRDFHGKQQDGKRRQSGTSTPLRIAPAPLDQGMHQQKFKVGTQGLHEVKKRKKRSHNVSQRTQRSQPMDIANCEPVTSRSSHTPGDHESHTELAVGVVAPVLSYFGHDAVTTTSGIEHSRNTVLGNCMGSISPNQRNIHPRNLVVGNAAGDPFETLPKTRCPRAQALLHHGASLSLY